MSELTIVVLRLGLFALLWIFVFSVAAVLRRDMFGARATAGRRRGRRSEAAHTPTAPPPSYDPVPIPPPEAVTSIPRTLYVAQGSLAGTAVPLGQTPITIGRSHSSTLVLSDDFASGKHARVFPSNGAWWIEDAGSTNGTIVDGQRIFQAVQLKTGSRITIGHTVMELTP